MPSKGFNPAASRAHQRIPPTRWYPSLISAALNSPLPRGGARYWLTLEGSLTRALQVRCRERFHVDVLDEGFALPTLEEARTLGIPPRQVAWIREVQLCGDGQPWVMARTIIPRATLAGRGRRLRHLGRKPLGAYLFSRPEWQRGPFQTGLCHPGANGNQPLVARRSRFYSGGAALLVGEYFLPAVL
ncbi:chorismate--pyruvate lyase family protein [Marinobacter changyiensis]|uniref:chorismate--pyruvate lyase family protein n=1 Tax=Marinobacter changyiensis TaxID=2604091 RepID=UPI001264FAA4|nr:chorismate lyase [Marinobacter changyiensis]